MSSKYIFKKYIDTAKRRQLRIFPFLTGGIFTTHQ